MLAYASARLKTTVLTNAMLLKGTRLERLTAIKNERLSVQVSLDGARPEQHDAYRGAGSWVKTIDGIKALQACGFHVRLSTTETPANSAYLAEVCEFHRELGIAEDDHFIRPLARRGFSTEGLEVDMKTLVPELTVNVDGVFWHPLSTDCRSADQQQNLSAGDGGRKNALRGGRNRPYGHRAAHHLHLRVIHALVQSELNAESGMRNHSVICTIRNSSSTPFCRSVMY